jgi:hypothetical protein
MTKPVPFTLRIADAEITYLRGLVDYWRGSTPL